jgi:hypothetical protein
MNKSRTAPVFSRRLSTIPTIPTIPTILTIPTIPTFSNISINTIKNYVITDKRLGRGSSATVYLGYHSITKVEVAVKKFG